MNIVKLSLRQLSAKPLQTGFNVLLLALGIATITLLMLFNAQLQDKLMNTARGVDLVVGAKGSPLQIILSSLYHADVPTGNIPQKEADRIARHPMVAMAIPMALGDNLMGHRIVGTTADYVGLYHGELASGRMWTLSMEAVLGANVARQSGLKLGQEFASMHGLGAGGHLHDDNKYQVVGILKPSGTILDDLVVTSLQSVWDLHENESSTNPVFIPGGGLAPPAAADDADEDGKPREITALLVKYRSPLAVLALPRLINAQTTLQAASPVFESARLLQIVGFGLDAFRAFAVILIASAGLSVFIALYSALQERRFDLSVMRMLGSSRFRLFSAVLLEGMILSVGSALLGLALGHGIVELAGQANFTPGLSLTGRYWVPQEIWLLVLGVGVGVAAALIPAVQAYRSEIHTVLAEH